MPAVSKQQVEELRTIEPWSQEFGFRAFARKHGLKVNHVYYVRRKLGLPMVHLPRWHLIEPENERVRDQP